MPVYACLRGDCDNLALAENCFVLEDYQGRNWLCFETSLTDLSDPGPLIGETIVAQQKLGSLSGASHGTQVSMLVCDSVEELRRNLNQT